MTVFGLQDHDGGYAVFGAQADTAPSGVYVLAPYAAAPPPSLTLASLWALPGPWALIARAGAWSFADEPPSSAAKALNLGGIGTSCLIAWRADPALSASWWPLPAAVPDYQILVLNASGEGVRQLRGQVTLNLGNVTLTLPAGTSVKLADDDTLGLDSTGLGGQFNIGRSDARNMPVLVFGQAAFLTAAKGAVGAGGLMATASWRPRSLLLLGQDASQITASLVGAPDIRFWRDTGTAQAQRIRLPLFNPVDVSAAVVSVVFALNPALPFDPGFTRFDPASAAFLVNGGALATREGAAVGLTPATGVGFHFGIAPGKSSAYLAPYGRYRLVGPAGGGGNPFHLMPGLSGLERIEASPGDLIELVPAQAAFGTAASPATNDGESSPPRLSDACTTSWARLLPAASRSYFAQPLASVFYASSGNGALPRAADALVASLSGAEAPFPLAPYGNAFLPGINDHTPAAAIADFEHVYLSGVRGAVLGGGRQPVFSLDGKTLTAKGATPRGLMADIGPGTPSKAASLPTRRRPARASAAVAATPEGQWQSLYLAQGATSAVRLAPNSDGVVDPVIANAMMQPDLFLVYNNWDGHPIGTTGELDVGGFSFDWAPLPDDKAKKTMLMVAKFTTKVSLEDLFAMPERWRDAATLVAPDANGDPDIAAARKVFTDALDVARAAPPPLFDDFLQRIATSPAWTGIIVFNAPVDGNNMPPTLQILIAGIDSTLRAHHLAVDVTMLQSVAGVPDELGPSSVAGVISYEADAAAAPPPGDDYGFYTQSLQVGIFGSAVTSFHAEVGITANLFFGRPVELTPPGGPPPFANTFTLKGIYHLIAGVATVTFVLPDSRCFKFPAGESLEGGGFDRILDQFEIDMAGILPQGEPTTDPITKVTTHRAQITLSGALWFNPDPFGAKIDIFSYGVPGKGGGGLGLSNFSLEMVFSIDKDGHRTGPPTLTVEYSRLAVSEAKGTRRPGGILSGLPLKLRGILADDKGLDTDKLGGKPVHVLQIAGRETQTPHFALQFEMLIGSLGELSGVHAGLSAEMRLAWGPRATTADADGALVTIQLPGASGGFRDLNVQGMLKLVFGDANLMQVPYTDGQGKTTNVFVVLFNNVALSVMGINLPPKVVSDLILFSDPAQASSSSLAGCLAVRQT